MTVFRSPSVSRFEKVDDGFTFDLPGPYTLSWRVSHARERVQLGRKVVRQSVPILTGVAFVAAPYVAGAAIVAFAPPWAKPVGAAMLVPNPVADALWFAIGYRVGQEIVDDIPHWLL